MEYFYTCHIQKGIDYTLSHFRKLVRDILTDTRSWRKYGYTFTEHSSKQNHDGARHFNIYLAHDAYVGRLGFHGMSVANCTTNDIYINYRRWMTGAKKNDMNDPVRTTMTLNMYRSYVIQHEVGHILWGCTAMDHKTECIDKVAPIMLQQTNGVGGDCTPNGFPLEEDVPPSRRNR